MISLNNNSIQNDHNSSSNLKISNNKIINNINLKKIDFINNENTKNKTNEFKKKISTDKNSNLLKESLKGCLIYVVNRIKCKISSNIYDVQNLRSKLLDEINLYILHLDVIKIKKILEEEIKISKKLNEYSLDVNDIVENYRWLKEYY